MSKTKKSKIRKHYGLNTIRLCGEGVEVCLVNFISAPKFLAQVRRCWVASSAPLLKKSGSASGGCLPNFANCHDFSFNLNIPQEGFREISSSIL